MNGWEWAAVGIAVWFAVATALALIIAPVLRRAGIDPDRAWMEQCAVCGTTGELGSDGACRDEDACVAALDAALKAHTCGPGCRPD
jgi:hypothetical protein